MLMSVYQTNNLMIAHATFRTHQSYHGLYSRSQNSTIMGYLFTFPDFSLRRGCWKKLIKEWPLVKFKYKVVQI
jgi:hypothetical protein